MYKLTSLITILTCCFTLVLQGQAYPDFIPTIEIDKLGFVDGAAPRDFVINISENYNAQNVGSIVLKIPKMGAFNISFSPTATTSSVNGGTTVSNSSWTKTENSLFITLTLNTGVATLSALSIISVGLQITRKANVAASTQQSITVSIVDGSGGDANSMDNTYGVTIAAF